MNTQLFVAISILAALGAVPGAVRAQSVKIDSETLGGLEARSIGPATMSGRVAAVEGWAGDRVTIYAGAAGGGVWKSEDGGVKFAPVFDRYNQSIGAIAIDPSSRNTIWVGTGEPWVRNSVSVGDGVYKSTDAGENWVRVGLESSERIARIAVHPKDGNTVFVCALGHLFDDHPQRGVYRTRDGGKTWEQVLSVAPDTGCADLAIDPLDPATMYAAMWQVRRRPDFFTSGGPRSGFFKSTDGGSHWEPMKNGLPAGEIGRIAIAIAPSQPSTVYATIEAKKSGLYRSDDRGESWTQVNTTATVGQRPFYFSRMVVDPTDANRLYKMGTILQWSEDGGRTFRMMGVTGAGVSYHADVHDIWINPKHVAELVIATDGGLYISYDRGNAWRFVGTLPVSQFYHVSYDMAWPYNVYGGLQDNNSWYGPSRRAGGIANRHWQSLTGGDGFWAFPDPTDADIVYSEYQGGNLFRVRRSTLESKDIKPSPRQGEPRFRFNWNTPIHLSPNAPGVVYYGAQFLFRSRDRGESWERISPDLTTNDPAKQRQDQSGGLTPDNSSAENHCTIYAIAESPKSASVVWVGTDDGNLQVTRDGGRTWTNVASNVRGLPAGTWVSSVEPGHFDEAVAYATFDGHMSGDMTTYVYRTADFGRTWESLSAGLKPQASVGQGVSLAGPRGYAHVVKEDLVNPDLLFLGTEFGLFVSIDRGRQWVQFTSGLPNVAVRDLAIHPREHDLIVATHGRGIYIVDDLTPLGALTQQVLDSDAAFLASRPSVMVMPVTDVAFNGDAEFVGRTPGETAVICYYLKNRHMFGDLRLEVYDAAGQLVATLPGGKRRGINRVEWPMRSKPPRMAPGVGLIPNLAALSGPRVLEGTYTVRLVRGSETLESRVDLVPDPRSPHSPADRAAAREAAITLYGLVERLASLVVSLDSVRNQARARAATLKPGDDLGKRLEAFAGALDDQRSLLVSMKQGEGISADEKLREELGALYGNVNGYEGRPTASQLNRMAVLGQQLDEASARFDRVVGADLRRLNEALTARGMEGIAVK
jgi:photosystem II stability/assembly factor-like uncharacterized protein